MNYTNKQIQIITRSNHDCRNRSLDLNYPSFIAYFDSYDSGSKEKVSVEPQKMVFKKKLEKLSYTLTLEGPRSLKEDVVHGSLSWVHDGGKYIVRSPVVATSVIPMISQLKRIEL
ncbi:SUBTILISIN-LIKE PROTEASE SBT1.9 [Salix purpurea]|uniref:SUBTILISIN-LIKE PROTEASE SBT1.9 n=1 Tax=Salix purpurea TaxID=77065 RepID=A0A9Q0V385_SALPP|nr:SUBTILISIN-LIKE PROTEASE SBT1.9 [Salix purpurea]